MSINSREAKKKKQLQQRIMLNMIIYLKKKKRVPVLEDELHGQVREEDSLPLENHTQRNFLTIIPFRS